MPPKETKREPSEYSYVTDEEGCAILFFCFFWFFGFLVSWFFGFLVFLVCVWIAQTLPMGLNFLFFCFFLFSRFWPNCKKPWKNQKKTKSSDPCPLPGLSPDLAHGSELFVFFVFSIVVLNVFHVKMLSSQYLSKKCASLQFAHLRPPGQTAKKNMEKPKFI